MSQTTVPLIACFRWPAKAVYLTADEASLALREIFYARHYYGPRLVAYQCKIISIWGTFGNRRTEWPESITSAARTASVAASS